MSQFQSSDILVHIKDAKISMTSKQNKEKKTIGSILFFFVLLDLIKNESPSSSRVCLVCSVLTSL